MLATPRLPPARSADFWRRAGGFGIDFLVIVTPLVVIGLPKRMLSESPSLWLNVATYALATLAWFLFEYGTARRFGATPGMQFVNLQLDTQEGTQGHPLVRRAAFFALLLGPSGMVPGLAGFVIIQAAAFVLLFSCLAIFWSPDGSTWHDRFSRTRVTKSLPEATLRSKRIIGSFATIGLIVYTLSLASALIPAVLSIRPS